jgi:hypothetical protein
LGEKNPTSFEFFIEFVIILLSKIMLQGDWWNILSE